MTHIDEVPQKSSMPFLEQGWLTFVSSQRQIILVAVAIVAIVLAACSTTTAPPAASDTAAARTKPYGSLAVASSGFGEGSIDPLVAGVQTYRGIGTAIFDTVVWYTPDGVLSGGIAERWEIAPDGKTFTFYVRKGVNFHDGSDVTGADVKFSIERMIKPETIAITDVNVWRQAIDRVELRDDYTVIVRLKTPQFELMKGIQDNMGAVVPKKYIEAKGEDYFRKNPIGSGPWKVSGFELGVRVDLQAVESHWRAVPKFEKVRLVNVKEEASVVAQLKTGELDMAVVSPDSVPSLKAAGVRIISFDGGARYYFVPYYDMNQPEKYAFGDVRVRKSLQLAINAKEIADKLLRGYGQPYALLAMDASAYFYDPDQIKVDAYDPEGAKKLLAEAGFPTGFGTRVFDTGGGSRLSTIDQAAAGYWRKIGVNAELVPMEHSAFVRMLVPQQKPEIWNGIWIMGVPAPQHFEYLPFFYHSTKSGQKMARITKLDELIDLVPQTADPAEKKQLAVEAAVMAKNNYSYMSIVDANTILGVSSKVGQVILKRPVAADLRGDALETITHVK